MRAGADSRPYKELLPGSQSVWYSFDGSAASPAAPLPGPAGARPWQIGRF